MFNIKNLLIIILFFICLLITYLFYNQRVKYNDLVKINESISDDLHHYRNKLNQEVTISSIIEGDYNNIKSLSKSKDSTIKKLVKEIDKKTIEIIALKNSTSGTVSVPTVIEKWDTIRIDNSVKIYPTYTSLISTKWILANINANKDSIHFNYKITNEFEIKEQYKRKWLFGKSQSIITITNLNPNTTTQELKSIIIKPKSKQGLSFGLGVVLGIGSIVGLNYLLK
jgi:hypothetical protein